MKLFCAAAVCLASLLGGAAHAKVVTMTFDEMDGYYDGEIDGIGRRYEENGIVVTPAYGGTYGDSVPVSEYGYSGRSFGSAYGPGMHMGIASDHYEHTAMFFLADGNQFKPVSIILDMSRYAETTYVDEPVDNIIFNGFRDGKLVATRSATTQTYRPETVLFDKFPLIDIFLMYVDDKAGGNIAYYGSSLPDIGFDADEFTIQPVPIPASLPLLLGGMALFGTLGRLRRRR